MSDTMTTLAGVVNILAKDPDYSTPDHLRALRSTFAIADRDLLSWIWEAGFYKPEGVIRVARERIGIKNSVITEWAKEHRETFSLGDWSQIKTILVIKED